MIKHRLLAAAVVAAVAIGAVGCGSSDDSASPATTTTVTEESTTTTRPVTAGFCEQLEQVGTASATPGELPTAEQATATADGLEELAGQAPTDELAAALRTLGSLYTKVAAVADDPEQVVGVLFAESANQDVVRAGTTIDAFVDAECG